MRSLLLFHRLAGALAATTTSSGSSFAAFVTASSPLSKTAGSVGVSAAAGQERRCRWRTSDAPARNVYAMRCDGRSGGRSPWGGGGGLASGRLTLPRLASSSSATSQANGEDLLSFGHEEYRGDVDDDDDGGDEDTTAGLTRLEENGDVELEEDSAPSPALVLYKALSTSLEAAFKAASKKRASLERELDKARTIESTVKRANLLVSNLYRFPPGTTTASVEDWDDNGALVELSVDTKKYGTAREEADALFAAARKMKRGSTVVRDLLEEHDKVEKELEKAREDLLLAHTGEKEDMLDEGRLELVRERLELTASWTGFRLRFPKRNAADNDSGRRQRGSSPKKKTRYEPTFRRFTSPAGLSILVGRNRRDNEAICFQVAKGDDCWMHARGCPGAHVLLQIRRGGPIPTDDCYQLCADLAAFYSDARTERRAVITAAEPKHILKPRGAPPGAVKLRQELGTYVGRPHEVPDELKAAREESRQFAFGDESGNRSRGGKARSRKRTAKTTRESQLKKRAERKEKKRRRGESSLRGEQESESPDWF